MIENDARNGAGKQNPLPAVSGTDQPGRMTSLARPIAEDVNAASFAKELLVSDKFILDYLRRSEAGECT